MARFSGRIYGNFTKNSRYPSTNVSKEWWLEWSWNFQLLLPALGWSWSDSSLVSYPKKNGTPIVMCFASIFSFVSAALLAIAFSADNWQIYCIQNTSTNWGKRLNFSFSHLFWTTIAILNHFFMSRHFTTWVRCWWCRPCFCWCQQPHLWKNNPNLYIYY